VCEKACPSIDVTAANGFEAQRLDSVEKLLPRRHAYALARANVGVPGVDGVTFKQTDASGVEAWLAG
jgi:hypothetical protein